MLCQACGAQEPTRDVHFHRHIGLFVVFIHTRVGGHLCERCVSREFWGAWGVTLFAGWWGLISFFATAFLIPYDLAMFLLTKRSFRHEPDGGAGARVAISAILGVLPLLGCLLGGPMLLLFAVARLIGAGAAHDASTTANALVCAGHPNRQAPQRAGVETLLAYELRNGRWEPRPDMVPPRYRNDAPAVIVCVEPEHETIVERCPAGDPPAEIWRTSYPREVRIVEARHIVEIARLPVESLDGPPPCDPNERLPPGQSVQRRSGARVQPEDVARVVGAWAREN